MMLVLAKRLLGLVPLLIGISLISFAVLQLAPGKPTDLPLEFSGTRVDPAVYQKLSQIYGLDQPLPIQYWNWLKRMAVLDFGLSMSLDRRPVIDKIAEALPLTIALNVISLAVVLAVSIPLGVYSAVRRGRWLDRVLTVFVFVGFSTPSFWLALMLMIVLGVHLGWLPISWTGMPRWGEVDAVTYLTAAARHGVLPIFCYSFGAFAAFSRYMRASMREALSQDYVVTARAKGASEWGTVWRHAFPNALLPIITLLGLTLPSLIGGSVVLEQVFAIPGMGRLFWEAVLSRDYTLIMGVLSMGAVLTLAGTVLADIGYALADPRIRSRAEGQGL